MCKLNKFHRYSKRNRELIKLPSIEKKDYSMERRKNNLSELNPSKNKPKLENLQLKYLSNNGKPPRPIVLKNRGRRYIEVNPIKQVGLPVVDNSYNYIRPIEPQMRLNL